MMRVLLIVVFVVYITPKSEKQYINILKLFMKKAILIGLLGFVALTNQEGMTGGWQHIEGAQLVDLLQE